jgi:hypothetical protein
MSPFTVQLTARGSVASKRLLAQPPVAGPHTSRASPRPMASPLSTARRRPMERWAASHLRSQR